MSPLFDLADLTAFADDKQIMESNRSLEALITNMEQKLEMITKWLKDSGLVVNEDKTKICLFYKQDHHMIEVQINGQRIKSKKTINVLGVTFDSKMQWSDQVSQLSQNLNGRCMVSSWLRNTCLKMK